MTGLADSNPSNRHYTPAGDAPLDVLKLRIETAMTYPHGHPGVPGLPDGGGCPRCNAEHALAVLIGRAKVTLPDQNPRKRQPAGCICPNEDTLLGNCPVHSATMRLSDSNPSKRPT